MRRMLSILLLFVFAISAGADVRPTASRREGKLVIVAIGDVDKEYLEILQEPLEKQFNLKSEIGTPIGKDAIQSLYDANRRQYHGGKLLELVQKSYIPKDATKFLGVMQDDLYDTNLNFIFGIAIADKTAIFSFARLKEGTKGGPKENETLKKRMLTEATHELGHTYKLGHCKNRKCVMFFSVKLADSDEKGVQFCEKCAKQAHLK